MSKRELRETMKRDCIAAGSADKELAEWKKLQTGDMAEPLSTITVYCSYFFSLFCCMDS